MARETKVGLITGLAFIICFAIILANRGQPVGPPSYRPYLVDQGRPVGESIGRAVQPAADRGLHAIESPASHTRAVDPAGVALGEQPTLSRAAGSASKDPGRSLATDAGSTGATLILPVPERHPASPRQDTTAQRTVPSDASTRARESVVIRPAPGGPGHVDEDISLRERQRLLREKLAAAERQSRTDNPTERIPPESTTPVEVPRGRFQGGDRAARDGRAPAQPLEGLSQPGQTSSPRAAPGGVRYVVAPGDTLTAIARRHYGTSAKRVIDAIFDANRGTLPSPDMVKVGMELVLPVIDGFDPPSGSAEPSRRQTVKTAGAGGGPRFAGGAGVKAFRWYQIRKGDRYVTIARDELGDPSRWREIYELNKDKFPEPDRIREGVRIKLPVDDAVAAAGNAQGR